MSEKTFFDYDGVKVTNARFVVDGQTFAMSNITSVSSVEETPGRVGPCIVGLLGAAMCASKNYGVGLLFIAAAAFWLWRQKSKFHVVLRTSGGENRALTSKQRNYVEQVVAALNEAIVHRG